MACQIEGLSMAELPVSEIEVPRLYIASNPHCLSLGTILDALHEFWGRMMWRKVEQIIRTWNKARNLMAMASRKLVVLDISFLFFSHEMEGNI